MEELVARAWWLAGSPCSGKSTAARALAEQIGARLYSCDDAFDRHAAIVSDHLGPTLVKVTTMSVQERLAQPVDAQVDDVLALSREQWPLVLADLQEVPGPVVVEGAVLLPELLTSSGVPTDRAVCIVATEDFQREHYARRPWAWDVLRATSDPAAAFERWMQRDARFATQVAARARACGYPVIITDGHTSAAETRAAITAVLDGALP